MSRAFSGMARLTGADLTGMPAACRDVSRAFAGMSAEAAVDVAVSMGGSGAAAGAVKLPERWDLTGAADASGIFAGAGFSSVEISGLGAASGLALEEAFAGCARLERVSLTGSASGHVANLRGAFAGCGALASVDLSGISTSGMGGSQASYGELSAMSGMWAGSGLVTGTGDATVKVGAGWTKVLNGFFGERAHAGAVPAYVLREGVRVEVTGGPAAAADLMPCPEGLSAEIYLVDADAAARQMSVWVRQGYANNLRVDNDSVIATVGDTGAAWGELILGYGFIGDPSQRADGTQVAWVIRSTDGTIANSTLTIIPNTRSGCGPSNMRRPCKRRGQAPPTAGTASGMQGHSRAQGFTVAWRRTRACARCSRDARR